MRWIDANWMLGLGGASRLSQVGLAFAVTPENTTLLSAGGEPLTISVIAPAAFSGSSVFAPSDLDTGPVLIVAPGLDVTPSVGSPVEVRSAIWAYGGTSDSPTRSWQWRADGVDIPGANQSIYVPTALQGGTQLSVVETATQAEGSRSAASLELTVTP